MKGGKERGRFHNKIILRFRPQLQRTSVLKSDVVFVTQEKSRVRSEEGLSLPPEETTCRVGKEPGSCPPGVRSSLPGAWFYASTLLLKNIGSPAICANAIVPLPPPEANLGQLTLEFILHDPRGSRVACILHDPGPGGSKKSWEMCSVRFKEASWPWCGGSPCTLQSWSAAPHLLLCGQSLSCFKRNTCHLNWWIFKCRLVCGRGPSIPHCWSCRCSWMVHNYSLKKLQTAIEPAQTLSLLTAHAKLSPTGNASVVTLQRACPKTTRPVQRRLLDF